MPQTIQSRWVGLGGVSSRADGEYTMFDLLMLDAQSIFVVIHEWGVRYRGKANSIC